MTVKMPVMELLVTVLDRTKAVQGLSFFRRKSASITLSTWGEGTATREILDILGIGEKNKVVILSIVPRKWLPSLITGISDEMQLRNAGRGILFTVPLSSLNRGLFCPFETALNQMKNEERVMYKSSEKQYELIVVGVEAGFVDPAMEAARAVGAVGGTVLNARASRDEDTESFFGLKLYDEMEILIILSPTESKMKIMNAIGDFLAEKSPQKSFIFSLPVNDVVGVGDRSDSQK